MAEGTPSADDARVRSFVAVDLDPIVLRALGSLQREFATHRADVRWVRPEGLHVTLKFLGEVERGRLDRLHLAIAESVRSIEAIPLRVHGLGAFPNLHRPRVVWVGLDDAGKLAALAESIENAAATFGFSRETRPFKPHVTLGRVNSPRGWAPLEEAVKAHIDDDFGACTVRAVIIYRSTLQRSGAVYTPLWTIPLTENRGTT